MIVNIVIKAVSIGTLKSSTFFKSVYILFSLYWSCICIACNTMVKIFSHSNIQLWISWEFEWERKSATFRKIIIISWTSSQCISRHTANINDDFYKTKQNEIKSFYFMSNIKLGNNGLWWIWYQSSSSNHWLVVFSIIVIKKTLSA